MALFARKLLRNDIDPSGFHLSSDIVMFRKIDGRPLFSCVGSSFSFLMRNFINSNIFRSNEFTLRILISMNEKKSASSLKSFKLKRRDVDRLCFANQDALRYFRKAISLSSSPSYSFSFSMKICSRASFDS